jgi:hypothetical protein
MPGQRYTMDTNGHRPVAFPGYVHGYADWFTHGYVALMEVAMNIYSEAAKRDTVSVRVPTFVTV